MHRSPRVATALAAIALAALLAPVATPPPISAAGECGAYRSETVPPSTIRVYRTASGAVDTVDFRTYLKNVLSREWISSWTTESLRSGALAVKNREKLCPVPRKPALQSNLPPLLHRRR